MKVLVHRSFRVGILFVVIGLVVAGIYIVFTILNQRDDSLVFEGTYVKHIACAAANRGAVIVTTDGVASLTSSNFTASTAPVLTTPNIRDVELSTDGSVLTVLSSRNSQSAHVDIYKQMRLITSRDFSLMLGAGSHIALNRSGTIVALIGLDDVLIWNTTPNTVDLLKESSGTIRNMFTIRDELVSTDGIIWPSFGNQRVDLLATLNDFSGHAFSLAVHPTKPIVAIGAEDGRIRLFDLEQHRLIQIIDSHTGTITALAFNHDGTWLAAGGGWGMEGDNLGEPEIRIWNVAAGRRVATLNPSNTTEISDICFMGADSSVIALTRKPWSLFGNLQPTVAHVWQIQ